MSSAQHPEAERLAELHWICHAFPAGLWGPRPPLWAELATSQRNSLITAMDLMLMLGHLDVGVIEDDEDE